MCSEDTCNIEVELEDGLKFAGIIFSLQLSTKKEGKHPCPFLLPISGVMDQSETTLRLILMLYKCASRIQEFVVNICS